MYTGCLKNMSNNLEGDDSTYLNKQLSSKKPWSIIKCKGTGAFKYLAMQTLNHSSCCVLLG